MLNDEQRALMLEDNAEANADEYSVSAVFPDPMEQYKHEYQEWLANQQAAVISPAVCARDLFSSPQVPATAYVEDFIYAGCTNALIGAPKAGKSTLVWSMVNAVTHGVPFLGKPCPRINVLYITEQSEMSFREQAGRSTGIKDNTNLFLLFPASHRKTEGAYIQSWAQRLELWKTAVERTRSSLLVLDTFANYADLGPGGENDNAIIGERLFDLERLRAGNPSLAILLLHHDRKNNWTMKNRYATLQDCRGGSAFAGALDHGVTIVKVAKDSPANVRYFHSESRIAKERKFDLMLSEHGEYQEVKKVAATRAEGDPRDEIAKVVAADPALLRLPIRKFKEAIKDLGVEASYRRCREFRKKNSPIAKKG